MLCRNSALRTCLPAADCTLKPACLAFCRPLVYHPLSLRIDSFYFRFTPSAPIANSNCIRDQLKGQSDSGAVLRRGEPALCAYAREIKTMQEDALLQFRRVLTSLCMKPRSELTFSALYPPCSSIEHLPVSSNQISALRRFGIGPSWCWVVMNSSRYSAVSRKPFLFCTAAMCSRGPRC